MDHDDFRSRRHVLSPIPFRNSALWGLPLKEGKLRPRSRNELVIGVGVAVETPTALGPRYVGAASGRLQPSR